MDPDDLIRELEKVWDALIWADRHFEAEAEMNAAQHMNSTVRPAPLASSIGTARISMERLVNILKEAQHGKTEG